MRIQSLQLTAFRNLAHVSLHVPMVPQGQIVALIGPNGAGKTSVLEALSLLSPGRGLHKDRPEELCQQGGKTWGMFVNLYHTKPDATQQDATQQDVRQEGKPEETTVGQVFQEGARKIKIDGVLAATQAELAHVGGVLWLSPRQDRLFLDGAASRRDYLDRLVFGLLPEHAQTVARYKHHVAQRLRILQTTTSGPWLDIEEQQAAHWGVQVLQQRQLYLAQLQTYLRDVTLELTGATLAVLTDADPVAALAGKFTRSRQRDQDTGATHTGPQKVDLTGFLAADGGMIPLHRASSGQHKRALLRVLLAHAQLLRAQMGQAPLVLLDEVTAHLDAQRRRQLLGDLASLGAQVWVTEPSLQHLGDLQGLPLHVIALHNGAVHLQEMAA